MPTIDKRLCRSAHKNPKLKYGSKCIMEELHITLSRKEYIYHYTDGYGQTSFAKPNCGIWMLHL